MPESHKILPMQITFESVHGGNEVYLDCLNALTGENRGSFLDIGCNHAPFTPQLGFKRRQYIDILPRELDYKDEQIHFLQEDILQKKYYHYWYNSTYALDVIEHLYKEDGFKMIQIMRDISDRQILFTPLDAWMMTNDEDKNPESHRSLWKPDDLDDTWVKIIFPIYHKELSIGAWFFMKCNNPESEFERIKNELKQKTWAKDSLQVHCS